MATVASPRQTYFRRGNGPRSAVTSVVPLTLNGSSVDARFVMGIQGAAIPCSRMGIVHDRVEDHVHFFVIEAENRNTANNNTDSSTR